MHGVRLIAGRPPADSIDVNSRLILCGDDFGRSAVINDAILALASKGKLTAASVRVNEPFVAQGAAALAELPDFDLGLHIALTDGTAITGSSDFAPNGILPTIDQLTVDAYLQFVSHERVASEIAHQFDAFETLFGRPPDYVGAHQHVHLIPSIRALVLNAAVRRNPRMWLRNCEEKFATIARRGSYPARAWCVALLSHGLRRDAAKRRLRTNDGFAGLYDLRTPGAFEDRFADFLHLAGRPNHLIICHPAVRAERGDETGSARLSEYHFLLSDQVAEMAAARRLTIGAFR